jgi:hypothetical protein
MADGRVVAYSRANASISSARSPVVSAARPGVHSRARSRSSAWPTVCRSSHSRSSRPSRNATCIIPRARAASVPGQGAMCQSAFSAVRERKGSTHTSRAPRRRASSTKGQRCTFELTMFAPRPR